MVFNYFIAGAIIPINLAILKIENLGIFTA